MSSLAKSLEKTLTEAAIEDVYEMQNSLVGSIVTSVAILNEGTMEQALHHYRTLRNDSNFQPANILEAVREVIKRWGKPEDLNHLCLITDKEGLRTPGVFPYLEDDSKLIPCALSRSWKLTGILLYFYTNPDGCDIEVLNEYSM